MRLRLQRYLAAAGIASRRDCEDLIAAGLVAVNGTVVTAPGAVIDAAIDAVTLRGRPVRLVKADPDRTCLLLNKPAGVVTTRTDPGGQPTVYDYVSEPDGRRLVYVGRLDRDTTGLLLMTTLGELAHRLMHPASGIVRRYEVTTSGSLEISRLVAGAGNGLAIGDDQTGPYGVDVLGRDRTGDRRFAIELREGKNREVRRMIAACGGNVVSLDRTRFAFLTLDGVERGRTRWLNSGEVRRLMKRVNLEPEKVES